LQVDEILNNEQTQAREMVGEFSHPLIGAFPYLKVPLKFEGFDAVQASHPPLLGEHTDEVLRELLGLDLAAIEALKTSHAI
jgi:crotonobetainyl-CoA:carnitine CoA-transferase CaiB-like acyl-CoA transferase